MEHMSETGKLRIWHNLCELMEPAEPEGVVRVWRTRRVQVVNCLSGEEGEEDEETVFGGLALAALAFAHGV